MDLATKLFSLTLGVEPNKATLKELSGTLNSAVLTLAEKQKALEKYAETAQPTSYVVEAPKEPPKPPVVWKIPQSKIQELKWKRAQLRQFEREKAARENNNSSGNNNNKKQSVPSPSAPPKTKPKPKPKPKTAAEPRPSSSSEDNKRPSPPKLSSSSAAAKQSSSNPQGGVKGGVSQKNNSPEAKNPSKTPGGAKATPKPTQTAKSKKV